MSVLVELQALIAQIEEAQPWMKGPEVKVLPSDVLPEDVACIAFMGMDGQRCVAVNRSAREGQMADIADDELGRLLWWHAHKRQEAKP